MSPAPRGCGGLPRDDAAAAAAIEVLVAPHRLHGVDMRAERDVLRVHPRALVAVFAPLRVVPAVLDRGEVVGIGDGLGVLVAGDDGPAVEDAVAESIARCIHVMHAAPAGADD